MMKWAGYKLPNDPGPIHGTILKAWYWVEDIWRQLSRMDKYNIRLVVLGLAFAVIIRLFGG